MRIADDERLGSRISDKKVRRVRSGDWLPRQKEMGKSVDRLAYGTLAILTQIAARQIAAQNALDGRERVFLGWAWVAAASARALEIRSAATPLFRNPYHAELFYPAGEGDAEDVRDAQRALAQQLADDSQFLAASP